MAWHGDVSGSVNMTWGCRGDVSYVISVKLWYTWKNQERVIWYIHRNPLKAGMIARLEEYTWNSYDKVIRAIREIRLHLMLRSSKTISQRWQILFVFRRKKLRMNVSKSIKNLDWVMHSLQICWVRKADVRIWANCLLKSETSWSDRFSRKRTAISVNWVRVLGLGKMIVEQALKR